MFLLILNEIHFLPEGYLKRENTTLTISHLQYALSN